MDRLPPYSMDDPYPSAALEKALEPGDTVLISDVHPVVPDSARFSVMNTGIVARRNRISIIPDGSGRGPYNPGDKIRIQFPNDVWGDMSTAVLKFRVQVTGTTQGLGNFADRFCVMQNGVASMFNLVNLHQGSSNPERIDHYGLLNRVLMEYELSPDHQKLMGPAIGAGLTAGDRLIQSCNIGGAGGGRSIEYTLPLSWLGLWRLHYVPFKRMSQWYIELFLDRAENVLLCDGNPDGFISGTYQVQDVNLIMDALEPKKWYENIIDDMILAEGGSKFKFFFDTWRHNSVLMSGLNNDFRFSEKAQSIKELVMVQRRPEQLNNFLRDSGATSVNDLRSYQFKIGSTIYPSEPIHVLTGSLGAPNANTTTSFLASSEPYQHALQTLRMWRWDLPNVGGIKVPSSVDFFRYYGVEAPATVSTSLNINRTGVSAPVTLTSTAPQFAVIVNFEKDRGFLSGINTFADNIDISVMLNYNSAQTSLQLDCFWCFDQVIKVFPNGDIGIFN